MNRVNIAANYIDLTNNSGHLQFTYEINGNLVQNEVQQDQLTLGDWDFPAHAQDHSSNTKYINNNDVITDSDKYATTELNLFEYQSDEYVWDLIGQINDSLRITGEDINYDVYQNSNSYITTVLWVLGQDIYDYLPDVTPTDVDRFPGVGVNILNGAYTYTASTYRSAIPLDIYGTLGNDFIRTGIGDDYISGGLSGSDRLYANAGNDTVIGGNGNDFLSGGIGIDTLTGGSGEDYFIGTLDELDGDTITDLEVGDVIQFSNINRLDVLDILGYSQVGDSVRLNFGSTSINITATIPPDAQFVFLTDEAIATIQLIRNTGSDLPTTPTPTGSDSGNSIQNASVLDRSAPHTESVGAGSDTSDYFELYASTDGVFTATLTGLSADIDLNAYVEGEAISITFSNAGGASDEQITFDAQAGQTYYLGIDPYLSAVSDYTLSTSFTETSANFPPLTNPVTPAPSEPDSSNSIQNAFTLDRSAPHTESVGSGNDSGDFFEVYAPLDGVFTATLTGLSADIDLYAYVEGGTSSIAVSNFGDASDEQMTFNAQAGQTYYIGVAPYQSAVSDYTLSTSFTETSANPSTPITPITSTPSGPDAGNYLENPSFLNVGSSHIESVGSGNDSGDYFEFTATQNGIVTATLTGLSADIDLYAYEEGLTDYIVRGYSSGNSNEQINFSVQAGQTYYLGIDPYQSAVSDYTLSTSFTETSANPSTPITPITPITSTPSGPDAGNSIQSASVLDRAAPHIESVGAGDDNDDYFEFFATNDGVATATLTGLSADLDLYAYVEGRASYVAFSYLAGNSNEQVTFNVDAGETYYLRVNAYGNSVSEYELDMWLV